MARPALLRASPRPARMTSTGSPRSGRRLCGSRDKRTLLPVRRCLIAASLVVALGGLGASGSSASTKPGWSLARASAYVELYVRYTDPYVVAQARREVALAKQLGEAGVLAQAEQNLVLARAGLRVDRALCFDLRAAPGGYASFRCRLLMSDDLGFKATANGVFRVGATRWYLSMSDYVRTGRLIGT